LSFKSLASEKCPFSSIAVEENYLSLHTVKIADDYKSGLFEAVVDASQRPKEGLGA